MEVGTRLDHRGDSQRTVVVHLLTGFEPCEAEKIEDQFVESLGLLLDPAEETYIHDLIMESSIQECLGVCLDRGEGGLQLVGDVGDEVLPHAFEASQVGNIVEDKHRAGSRRAG